jgi:Gene product 88
MKLLTTANTKIKKGEKMGFMSFGVHLAPEKLSGFNVCQNASAGCAAACLNTAGHGIFKTVQEARIKKTQFFFSDKKAFMTQLFKEIEAAIKKAAKNNMTPCFRLNLTSDLPWENIKHDGLTVMQKFPDVVFYDYTKSSERMAAFLSGDMPKNYQLTFSRSETKTNQALALAFLKSGGNVAAVFRKSLPETFQGFKVVNGDENDLRFLDPKGVIVGLVEKGLAKKDQTGFVLEPSEGVH